MEPVTTAKIFVGNISWGATDEQLRELFAQYGTVVEAVIIKDKFSGRSKGFGFVTMGSPEEAAAAIEALNGAELDGRPLNVNAARDKQ